MSADFLAAMAASSHVRMIEARTRLPESELRARVADTAAAPRLVLSGRFDLIAEVKLRSPAAGALKAPDEDIGARVRAYAEAGSAAISVLTEPSRFDGSMAHLACAAEALRGSVPAMRKDFLVDPYQVLEARVAGAGGVLIILRMLERPALRALIESSAQLGLFALLEAFDEQDLQLAQELVREYRPHGQLLVGINCRDLVTLKVVPGRLELLAALLPSGVPHVAESGVASAADATRLVPCGYDMALIGSALMQARDPLELARAMLRAGRAAAMSPCG
jgi:indole-3-glycerol phosphate synthase